MLLINLTSAQSPYTFQPEQFSNLVNFPYVLVVAKGGGTVEVNLPRINTINGSGTIIGIVGDSTTTLVMNVAGSDIISENGGNTVASKSITGNKSFLIFDATYILTGGIWVDTTSGSGGGGGTPPFYYSVTYSALVGLISGNNLIAGAFYLINDFASATYIQYSGTGSGGIGGEQVHIGSTEPLLVQATSINTLSGTAVSLTYPNDVIQYSVNMPNGHYEYAASQGTGCIIYREDTLNQVARDYDWRNVVFWRWETSLGSGQFWNIQPPSGGARVAHIEIGCFWNTGNLQNVYIKSPLAANPFLNGSPYWLDNFVVNAGGACIGLQVNLAYGSTYSEYTAGAGILGESNYNNIAYDTIICDTNANNTINQSQQNFVNLGQGAFELNNIGVFFGNNINDTSVGAITGNNVSNAYNNQINQLQNNSGSILTNNSNSGYSCLINNNQGFAFIGNNLCSEIVGNIADIMVDNTCARLSGNISNSIKQNTNYGNISNNIANNINFNTNSGNIINNTVDFLSENNSNVENISANVCGTIQNNSNNGDIDSNYVYQISNNSNTSLIYSNYGNIIDSNSNNGEIGRNFVYDITSNTNNGAISQNVGDFIDSNSNGDQIYQNYVQRITNNTVEGEIVSNVGQQIDSNAGKAVIDNNYVAILSTNTSTGIRGNVGAFLQNNTCLNVIEGNTFYQMTGNTISHGADASNGKICYNACTYIFNNIVYDGNISSNVGNSITGNTVDGGIDQNNCNLIDSNNMKGKIANNQYNIIAFNTLADITNSTGNKFFNNTGSPCVDIVGSLQNCDITAPIQSHNFIDEVISFTINPSADMQTTTPTKSMYDEGFGQHYLALLSSGAFTFPIQITA